MSRSALVTCGEQRSALSIVRSLGRAGFRVEVSAARRPSLAGASRHTFLEHSLPDPAIAPAAFESALAGLLEAARPDVVIPVTEPALLAGLGLSHRFPATTFPFPDLETFTAVCDKTRVFEAARDLGIAVPDEVVLRRAEDLSDASRLGFPVVVKPARSVSGTESGRSLHRVAHAANADGLEGILAQLPEAAFPVHVQRRIVGPGTGVFLLRHDGRILARFAHRRLREKPPSGGVSVYCESVAMDPELFDQSARLLGHFDWEGVAMVEFKRDASTGTPYLMEINGRFWGSLELAVSSGVDFPRLLVDAALGQPVDPVVDYRVGVRSRWMWGDVDQLLSRLRRSAARLNLPPGSPGRLRAAAGFLAAFARGRPDVFRLGDPAPAWRETVDWFAELGRKGRA